MWKALPLRLFHLEDTDMRVSKAAIFSAINIYEDCVSSVVS